VGGWCAGDISGDLRLARRPIRYRVVLTVLRWAMPSRRRRSESVAFCTFTYLDGCDGCFVFPGAFNDYGDGFAAIRDISRMLYRIRGSLRRSASATARRHG
jgi:hypothetical protein